MCQDQIPLHTLPARIAFAERQHRGNVATLGCGHVIFLCSCLAQIHAEAFFRQECHVVHRGNAAMTGGALGPDCSIRVTLRYTHAKEIKPRDVVHCADRTSIDCLEKPIERSRIVLLDHVSRGIKHAKIVHRITVVIFRCALRHPNKLCGARAGKPIFGRRLYNVEGRRSGWRQPWCAEHGNGCESEKYGAVPFH